MFKQHLFMSRADRAAWRATTSLADLGELTARWLEGTLASHPGYAPNFGPDEETTHTPGLVRALALCNRAGFVTECSQPGLIGTDRYLDWWAQHEAVSGLVADQDVLHALRRAAVQHGLLYVEHRPDTADRPRPPGIVVTTVNGEPWTRLGDWMPPEDVRFLWKGAGEQAVTAAQDAWQVTLVNPVPGPFRQLLTALVEAFADPAKARCVHCGCTEDDPCPGGCRWVASPAFEDLYSTCPPPALFDDAGDDDHPHGIEPRPAGPGAHQHPAAAAVLHPVRGDQPVQPWNHPGHRIAGTERAALAFADGKELVLADWEVSEAAPDQDGRVYATLRGWIANATASATPGDGYVLPVEAGRAHLLRADLRGRDPLSDLLVHIDVHRPGAPHPNSWDHPGYLCRVSWMDRRIDAAGHRVPEAEIGTTHWTDPADGREYDLEAAYLPEGERYNPLGFTWRHYDRWHRGVPLLHPFYADDRAPAQGLAAARALTDGPWVLAAEAPAAAGR
ncbi:DUF6919 domain-containing protein [Kitasatospora sp. NPDC048296]|uniref:DUF6919 domain-containing protein n=1 Tax=Kitasatospora sp. NPDC048296 TaxID=3364048 RepID=UPI0037236B44